MIVFGIYPQHIDRAAAERYFRIKVISFCTVLVVSIGALYAGAKVLDIIP